MQSEITELLIEVWIIQESLAPEHLTSIKISSDLTIDSLKHLICTELNLELNRYELLLLKHSDSSYILKELKNTQLRIFESSILSSSKVCLKFEDINWDFSGNNYSEFSNYTTGNTQFLRDRIKLTIERPKNKILFKKIQVIKKNLSQLLSELKMEY